MNILDAANATVHDYLGGSESLGPRVGLSAAALRRKVSPRNDTQQLTIAEADRIMALTGDFRMLKALAHQHGFLLVESPDPDASDSDMEALEQSVCFSDTSDERKPGVRGELKDRRIDERELRATRAAQCALQAVAANLTAAMQARLCGSGRVPAPEKSI